MSNFIKNKPYIFVAVGAVVLLLLIGLLFWFLHYQQEYVEPEPPPVEGPPNGQDDPGGVTQEEPPIEEPLTYQYTLSLTEQHDQLYFRLVDFAELFSANVNWDSINRSGYLKLQDQLFTFIDEVPVLDHDGIALPIEWSFLVQSDLPNGEQENQEGDQTEAEGDIYFPVRFLTDVLQLSELELEENERAVHFNLTLAEEAFAHIKQRAEVNLADLSRSDLIEYLSFLGNPIPGARISTRDSHLPGAPRPYRNGYHEGIDWYSGTSGINISLDTPVRAMADGVIVRVDHGYVEMTLAERSAFLNLSHRLNDTPIFILDKLRGRSVWVQHEHGVLVRYVHLSNTAEAIEVGQRVERGDVLGYVGNSGTSFAIDGDLYGGLHLHADVLIYGELFWKHLSSPADVRYVLENIFRE